MPSFRKVFIIFIIFLMLAVPIWVRLSFLTSAEHKTREIISGYRHSKVTLEGVIDVDPDIHNARQNFTIKTLSISHVEIGGDTHAADQVADQVVDKAALTTRVLINTKLYPRYNYGDMLAVTGTLIAPRNFSDTDSADVSVDSVEGDGRQFDYIHYLSKDGIFFIMKDPVMKQEGATGAAGNPLYGFLFRFKDSFLENIRRALGEPQASLAAGLVVGEKGTLGKGLLDDFRRSGLIHVVILSGYSINIIASSVRSLLSFLPRKASLIGSSVAIILFGILVGGKATVVRACAMALVVIVAELLYRDYNALRALLFVAYLMILYNPYIVLYDASFQVSFVSTLGLILFGRYIEKCLAYYPMLFPERFGIRSLITSTVATQISVAPLLLYMMGDASLVGVFANLLVLPLIPISMVSVFACGMSGYIFSLLPVNTITHIASLSITAICYTLLSYQLYIVHFFGNIPYGIFYSNNFSVYMMWSVYCIYAVVYFLIVRRQRKYSRSPPS